MLNDLPTELLAAICDYLTNQDLQSLRQVSGVFKEKVSPALFNTITFRLDDHAFEGWDVTPTGHKKDYEALKASRCFSLIKNLYLQTPIHQNTVSRCCYHLGTLRDNSTLRGIAKLQHRLQPLLEQLEDHSLQSFSWDLGLCVPREILGPTGYLSSRQAKLQSLSLITSTDCSSPERDWAEPILLPGFTSLRKISWKCLRSPNEYQNLRDLLHANFNIFENLAVESGFPAPEYPEGKHSLEFVLPHTPDKSTRCFPPLRSLSVSDFSLTAINKMISPVIDFSQLRYLALQNCTDISIFLNGIIASGQHVALKHLELKFQDCIYQGWGTSSLVRFLQSFEGLEDLYLMIDPGLPTEMYWDSMASHHWTLKRFIYHEGRIEFTYLHFDPKETFRDSALKWGNKNRAYPWLMLPVYGVDADSSPAEFDSVGIPLHGILVATTIDCLALCDSPAVLRKMLEPYVTQLTFKLLHIRRTAVEVPYDLLETIEEWIQLGVNEENPFYLSSFSHKEEYNMCMGLFDLVSWAFGPDGIRQLQVLAFGDFCHNRRFPKQSILFCRQRLQSSKINWRLAQRGETGVFDGIDRPMDFLAACHPY